MRVVSRALLFFLGGYVFAFLMGAGFWLLSNTEYPFARTVGGSALVGACVFVFCSVPFWAEWDD
jgi:hypothetical protein